MRKENYNRFLELEPCRICGARATMVMTFPYFSVWAECTECKAASETFTSKKKARDAWNKGEYREDTETVSAEDDR